ncbi:hypothetical protein VE06_27270 [Salmonella enterica subsp. enterica serovar Indiana]|nr:hypothetical protein VE06_27270 [Salmonella enterica subsp. enterica serovar Indiana]
MLGGADNPNGELLSYIIGADTRISFQAGMPGIKGEEYTGRIMLNARVSGFDENKGITVR